LYKKLSPSVINELECFLVDLFAYFLYQDKSMVAIKQKNKNKDTIVRSLVDFDDKNEYR